MFVSSSWEFSFLGSLILEIVISYWQNMYMSVCVVWICHLWYADSVRVTVYLWVSCDLVCQWHNCGYWEVWIGLGGSLIEKWRMKYKITKKVLRHCSWQGCLELWIWLMLVIYLLFFEGTWYDSNQLNHKLFAYANFCFWTHIKWSNLPMSTSSNDTSSSCKKHGGEFKSHNVH